VNEGRDAVGTINRNIGKNPDPATVKFSGKEPYEV
jgi:photosystem I subunit 2